MPKLKEANSSVGFQNSIPVGFYSIMTYSAPSVMLPVSCSPLAQMDSIAVNMVTNVPDVCLTAVFNHQYS